MLKISDASSAATIGITQPDLRNSKAQASECAMEGFFTKYAQLPSRQNHIRRLWSSLA